MKKSYPRITCGSVFLLLFLSLSLFLPLSYAEELSQPVYSVIEELDVRVTMRDGVRLSTNIYRPDTEGTFPALLLRTPYGNGGKEHRSGHYFAERGYIFVTQDCRGRFESEGLFNPMQDEAPDGYDTQEWVGAQPWCNGTIGTSGGSYVGFTQWISAPLNSKYLVTMFPTVTVADFYHMAYYGGAFRLRMWDSWAYWMTAPYDFDSEALNARLSEIEMTLPLIGQDKEVGWRVSFLHDWLSHPEPDTYWDRITIRDGYKNIKASSYSVGGWFDICQKGTLDNFIAMTAETIDPDVRAQQKLLLGPWTHALTRDGKVGDLDFGKDAVVKLNELQLRWFDFHLKGADTGIENKPPVKIFVMGGNTWRAENEWPLARTDYRKFYFDSVHNAKTVEGDGYLGTEKPSKSKEDTFIYDPENPVPSSPDENPFLPMANGPKDHRVIEQRDDVLVYSTPPLEKDIEVTGPVEVILYAASSAFNTDFTAKLCDVWPDGRSMRLCDGIIRASYRNGPNNTSNIETGKVYEYHIDLWSTSNVFKKAIGSGLRYRTVTSRVSTGI